jgi:hypothetical protein
MMIPSFGDAEAIHPHWNSWRWRARALMPLLVLLSLFFFILFYFILFFFLLDCDVVDVISRSPVGGRHPGSHSALRLARQ